MTCQNLTMDQIASYAAAAGCPPGDPLAYAVAIAAQESSGRTCSHNTSGEDSRGLWQINVRANPQYSGLDLYDPAVNAGVMVAMSGGCRNWNAWGGYTDGGYLKYLSQARAAAGAPAGIPTPAPSSPPIDDSGPPIVFQSLPGYVAFDPTSQSCQGQTYQSPIDSSWSCSGAVTPIGTASGAGAAIAGIDLSQVPWWVWAMLAVGIGVMFL